MDSKDQINGDLKEPIRREYSSFELARRRWGVLRAAAIFVAGYSTLHRGIIPMVLKFFPVTNSAYTHIDPWFLVPVSFVFFSEESRKSSFAMSWFAGMGILQCFFEGMDFVYHTKELGWVGISHMISATPFALISIVFLSGKFKEKKPAVASLGALSVLLWRLV